MRSTRPRRAYTLVEVVVAIAVGIIVLVLLWTLISTMTRSFASSRDLLGSLQGAFLLVETVKNDLAGLYFEQGHKPLEVSDNFFDLSFYVFDPESNTGIGLSNPAAALERVRYAFDPKTNMVSRNGKVLTFARFERVIFYFQAPQFQNVAEKRYGNYVTLRVTCAPDATIEANRNRADADRITKSVVTLITSVSVQQKASQELFPLWNRNQEPTVRVE
ncbi:MAG: prepilin-type N-terminal cleavage/methylation domain-containing protein [Candidatus Riflebacteria bacterium]|nr:prepilin-type N-terminal cleavage/methylation domain-containing protein [Candidatus Riflebacteria bacterium]